MIEWFVCFRSSSLARTSSRGTSRPPTPSASASSATATGDRTSSATSTASTAAELVAVCDKNPAALSAPARRIPALHLTTDFAEVLRSPDIDAVAVVTPVWTHYELAKAALENGKHVFVEKPFTSTSQQAEELIELAERKNLKIMVDHTFLFSGAVRKIREIVDAGTLGPLLLLRLDARQPRALPARRQRHLGPRAARSVDHGPHHRGEARSGGGDRRQAT